MAAVRPCWKHACPCVYIQYVMSCYLIVIILSVYLLFSCGFTDWQSQTQKWIKRTKHNQKCLWRGLLFTFLNSMRNAVFLFWPDQKYMRIHKIYEETNWLLYTIRQYGGKQFGHSRPFSELVKWTRVLNSIQHVQLMKECKVTTTAVLKKVPMHSETAATMTTKQLLSF